MRNSIALGLEPVWKKIETAATYSMPPCACYISVLSEFVRLNAGGVEGELLHELAQFKKQSLAQGSASKKALGSEFWAKLGSMNFGKGVKYPYMQTAIVKTNLSAPINKVIDGVCKLITVSHIASMQSKDMRSTVEEAEQIMDDSRKLCTACKLDSIFRVSALGRLDVRLVLHILKLGKAVEGRTFDNVNEIAEAM